MSVGFLEWGKKGKNIISDRILLNRFRVVITEAVQSYKYKIWSIT